MCLSMIFLLLLLGGCVSGGHWTWQHQIKQGELQLLKDKKECRDLARSEVANINFFYDYYGRHDFPFYWPYYRDRYRRPYFRNYNHNYGDYSYYRFLQQQNELDRFFRICMKVKGWERVKVKSDPKQPAQ